MSLNSLIDQLLYEEESNTLDFKKEQYRFSGATDEEKVELLKDILAFANATRRAEAIILIGVSEIKGGRSEVVGIQNHIDDAHLQQFVNTKTQRPIEFSYRATSYEGKQLAVIQIPVQRRPFYLARDFGRLKSKDVYIRRGSSTAIASIDEISFMGAEHPSYAFERPVVRSLILDGSNNEIKDSPINLILTDFQLPPSHEIPDYGVQRLEAGTGISMVLPNIGANRDYYRELAKYYRAIALVKSFKLSVENLGKVSAFDVKVTLDFHGDGEGLFVCSEQELPDPPVTTFFNSIHRMPHYGEVGGDVLVNKTSHGWRVVCQLGKVQPKDTVVTVDKFYIGSKQSQKITATVKIFCDDLEHPIEEILSMCCEVQQKDLPTETLLKALPQD